jgi:adenylate cyclase
MSSTRQLAAILFTDIAGYTAMMQRDEQAAVTMVKHHRTVLEKTVSEFDGEVIEFYGDGSLCIFNSITQAVHCAHNIQKEMRIASPPVPLRIGLHIGEVIYEDGKIMGDGVNIAARIQSLGQPGSILFSREVFDKIRNHHEFKTTYLGKFNLKNVAEPMEISALSNEGLVVPAKEKIEGRIVEITTRKKLKAVRKWILLSTAAIVITLLALFLPGSVKNQIGFTGSEKSIAVLPFENISNDSLQQYFSDGMTEDIITQLSKIADLKVISRTSVMQYKDNKKNL